MSNPGEFQRAASLFRDWGGEIVGWVDTPEAEELIQRLAAYSSPSIVDVAVAGADLGSSAHRLWTTAVGVLFGLDHAHHEWSIRAGVPAERILAIRHPDAPSWPEPYAFLRR